MKHCFRVDGLIYELRFTSSHEIQLAITGGASPTFKPEYDPFDWDYTPFVTDDIAATRYPVTVMRHALRKLYEWIGREQPMYFAFSARNERRCRLYRRVAQVLIGRFPEYRLVEYRKRFYFYRLKKSATV